MSIRIGKNLFSIQLTSGKFIWMIYFFLSIWMITTILGRFYNALLLFFSYLFTGGLRDYSNW